MRTRPFRLHTLTIGDDLAGWASAGFAVDGGSTRVGDTVITFAGTDRGRGILAAGIDGVVGPVDGLPFEATAEPTAHPAPRHANGVIGIDHVVATSPDMDRTTEALGRAGLDRRRTRTFAVGDRTRRQCFFWMGDVILELVGDDDAHGDGPARLWGLAFTCADLAAATRLLGDRLGSPKPAVQEGREIATLRTDDLHISVPVVFMSSHADAEVADTSDA